VTDFIVHELSLLALMTETGKYFAFEDNPDRDETSKCIQDSEGKIKQTD
jgi:hypothetical protein